MRPVLLLRHSLLILFTWGLSLLPHNPAWGSSNDPDNQGDPTSRTESFSNWHSSPVKSVTVQFMGTTAPGGGCVTPSGTTSISGSGSAWFITYTFDTPVAPGGEIEIEYNFFGSPGPEVGDKWLRDVLDTRLKVLECNAAAPFDFSSIRFTALPRDSTSSDPFNWIGNVYVEYYADPPAIPELSDTTGIHALRRDVLLAGGQLQLNGDTLVVPNPNSPPVESRFTVWRYTVDTDSSLNSARADRVAALFAGSRSSVMTSPTRLHLVRDHWQDVGDASCLSTGCCCVASLAVGSASPSDVANGYTDVASQITNDPNVRGGLALHLRFNQPPGFQPGTPYFSVANYSPLSAAAISSLSAQSISLIPGRYWWQQHTSPFGDLYLSSRVRLLRVGLQYNSTAHATGITPISVAIGDLNGDDHFDLVSANVNGNSVSVMLGDGNGGFSAPTDFGTAPRPYSVAIGDLNLDGKPDLVVADELSPGYVSVLIGDGKGGFAPRVDYGAGTNAHSIAVGDFNGDQVPDLAVGHYYSNVISLFMGDGHGAFAPRVDFGAGIGCGSLAVADLNGDGRQDIVTANASAATYSIFLGDGTGEFSRTDYASGPNPYGPAIADLDGDGDLDLATAHYYLNTISVNWNNGAGDFSTSTSFPAGTGPGLVEAGDMDGDGIVDLVSGSQVSGGQNYVWVMRGTGSGGFAAPVSTPTGDYPIAIALGDLTGDHRLEIATADHLDNTITVLRNTLSQVSTPPTPTPTEFSFGPVMPNPTSGKLNVGFSLPRHAHVRIALHDIMGRRIAQLANADFPAGRHEVRWNGSPGAAVTPGVYLLQCEMGGRSFAERLTIRR